MGSIPSGRIEHAYVDIVLSRLQIELVGKGLASAGISHALEQIRVCIAQQSRRAHITESELLAVCLVMVFCRVLQRVCRRVHDQCVVAAHRIRGHIGEILKSRRHHDDRYRHGQFCAQHRLSAFYGSGDRSLGKYVCLLHCRIIPGHCHLFGISARRQDCHLLRKPFCPAVCSHSKHLRQIIVLHGYEQRVVCLQLCAQRVECVDIQCAGFHHYFYCMLCIVQTAKRVGCIAVCRRGCAHVRYIWRLHIVHVYIQDGGCAVISNDRKTGARCREFEGKRSVCRCVDGVRPVPSVRASCLGVTALACAAHHPAAVILNTVV